MTLNPECVGDKGQRYEIRYCSDENGEDMAVLGWSGTLIGANRMRDAWKLRPSSKYVWVVDRWQPKPVNNCSL